MNRTCQTCEEVFDAKGGAKYCDPCKDRKANLKRCKCGADFEVHKRPGGQPKKCPGCRDGSTYALTIRCGRCAGPTKVVTERAQPGARVAIVRCRECLEEMILRAQIIPARSVQFPNEVSGCGTSAGYARHLREQTKPCPPCIRAHSLATTMRAERRAG